MDQKLFECIKRGLTDRIVADIMERTGCSEDNAIRAFMNSKVYDRLQEKDTEVYRFSVRALSELYEDEMNGNLVWPVAP